MCGFILLHETMGWWPVNFDLTTDDRIGDTAADMLGEAFSEIARQRLRQGDPPPELQEVLDTLASLLTNVSANLYEHRREGRIAHLTASILQEGVPAATLLCSSEREIDKEDLTQMLLKALQDVAQTYQEDWERLPRLCEVLALFAFVLSDKTCSSKSPFSVQSITATILRKIQVILSVSQGYEAPPAPPGYRRERNGVCWEYFSDSAPDFDSAKAVGNHLASQPGVSNVEVYDVALWQ